MKDQEIKKMLSKDVPKHSYVFWGIIFCGLVFAFFASYLYFSPDAKPMILKASSLTYQEIEAALRGGRIYIYENDSNGEDCDLLKRDHGHYHDIVAATEKFLNTNCGDVKVFVDDKSIPPRVITIAKTIEDCRCQMNYVKNNPKVNLKQKVFTDDDLH